MSVNAVLAWLAFVNLALFIAMLLAGADFAFFVVHGASGWLAAFFAAMAAHHADREDRRHGR